MNITIRKEKPKDHLRVEEMTRAAFWNDDKLKKDNIGATEHYLVHQLRDGLVLNDLNLVALHKTDIVGHIMLSKGSYVTNGKTTTDVL
ncbi:MAG: N-acetyltransferase, partial [Candidatus Izimaplasma sp.]|nr:N-acetyltransferase [Candidatus Izimaplasma bacterium]